MSTRAQALLEQIKMLPMEERKEMSRQFADWLKEAPHHSNADDPIVSARGMFAGSRLTQALIASRMEDGQRG